MVPNSRGYPPAAWTPFLTALASRSSGRLQGVISFQLDATPICGLAKSSSPMPTARSIPRAAVFSRPSVTSRLRGLRSGAEEEAEEEDCVMGTIVPDRCGATRTGSDGGSANSHHVGEVGH